MKPKTTDMARGKWPGILKELGVAPQYLQNRHGPCPFCAGNDRYRFDDKNGNGTYFCSGCGAGDGMKLAMQWTGLSFKECAARIDTICGHVEVGAITSDEEKARKTRQRLIEIGKALQPIAELDPVGRYLRRRGIKHAPPEFIRYHPAMPYYDKGFQGTHPAMVAAFRRPDNSIETFHVTYLTSEGFKASVESPRKVIGAQKGLNGCAVRLSAPHDHIGIAEGIETALSVTQLYGVPCWSCYSANGMESFIPPDGVKKVTIYADADANYTGQAAATACAKRLAFAGFDVELHEFPAIGKDYNDILLERTK